MLSVSNTRNVGWAMPSLPFGEDPLPMAMETPGKEGASVRSVQRCTTAIRGSIRGRLQLGGRGRIPSEVCRLYRPCGLARLMGGWYLDFSPSGRMGTRPTREPGTADDG